MGCSGCGVRPARDVAQRVPVIRDHNDHRMRSLDPTGHASYHRDREWIDREQLVPVRLSSVVLKSPTDPHHHVHDGDGVGDGHRRSHHDPS